MCTCVSSAYFFSSSFWVVSVLPSECPVSSSLDIADTYCHAIPGWLPCFAQGGIIITSGKIIITLLNLSYSKKTETLLSTVRDI